MESIITPGTVPQKIKTLNLSAAVMDEIVMLLDAYAELAYEQMQPTPGDPDSGYDRPFVLPEQKALYLDDLREIIEEALTAPRLMLP